MRILIADDERYARQRIASMLEHEHDVEVVGECETGDEVINALKERPVDVLFLDIQMPGMNGFEVLPYIAEKDLPLVVFVSAYDEHALRAFEVNAFDYLLKPFDHARLQQALKRARLQVQRVKQGHHQQRLLNLLESLESSRNSQDRFAIKNGGRIFFVRADDIDWIEAEHNYVRLHVGADSYLLREKLSGMEAKLDHAKFRRIHRSTIINIDRIKELQPWFRGDYIVMLQSGQKLVMSRTFRDALKDLFD